jgi:hypothetical protein
VPVVAAAVVAHPPAIVPHLAQRAAPDLDALRSAADAAVAAVLNSSADVLFAVGSASSTVRFDARAGGTFAPWGLALRVGPPDPAGAPLPLSLTVAAWLLERSGAGRGAGFPAPACRYQSISLAAGLAECRALGLDLAGSAERVALLVMGDGSARRGEHCPGGPHPEADAFDLGVAAALAAGDAAYLLGIDPALAGELLVAGRPAWQVLAGAVGTAPVAATLRYADAPFGVGYFVANWSIGPGVIGPGTMAGMESTSTAGEDRE